MKKNYAVIMMLTSGVVEKVIQARKPSLEQLQQAVGGYIELVPRMTSCTFEEQEYTRGQCYCNEYGKIKNMPYNKRATEEWLRASGSRMLLDHLRGDVVFVAQTEEGATQ